MSIGGISPDQIRTPGGRGVRDKERPGETHRSGESARSGRVDSVELSAEGLALAAEAREAEGCPALSPERLAQIRARIDTGAYNDLSMAEEVARRLVASGDIA